MVEDNVKDKMEGQVEDTENVVEGNTGHAEISGAEEVEDIKTENEKAQELIDIIDDDMKKNKKGSIRTIKYNSATQSNGYNKRKYLNISVCFDDHVGIAEWSLQLFDTECPFGVVGSIPAADVFSLDRFSPDKVIEVVC